MTWALVFGATYIREVMVYQIIAIMALYIPHKKKSNFTEFCSLSPQQSRQIILVFLLLLHHETTMGSSITGNFVAWTTACSDKQQIRLQGSPYWHFAIEKPPVTGRFPHKRPLTQKRFSCQDFITWKSQYVLQNCFYSVYIIAYWRFDYIILNISDNLSLGSMSKSQCVKSLAKIAFLSQRVTCTLY